MASVVSDTFSIYSLHKALENAVSSSHPAVLNLLSNIVLCDELIVHGPRIKGMGLADTCAAFGDVFRLVDLKLPPISRFIAEDGAKDIDREFRTYALDYLAAAQDLGVYLGLAPERSQFLKDLLGAQTPRASVSQAIVSRAQSSMVSNTLLDFIGVDVAVPPAGQMVARKARTHKLTLSDAAIEVRHSRHASAFRARCAEVDHEIATAGYAAVRSLQKLLKDVDRVTGVWAKDLDEGVRSVRRTISLRKLPLLGPLLEALGFAEFSLRDPVIRPRDPSLLFLNDLYRTGP